MGLNGFSGGEESHRRVAEILHKRTARTLESLRSWWVCMVNKQMWPQYKF